MSIPRVLLLSSTTSYRTEAFVEAARRLGAEGVVGSDRCHVLDGLLDFRDGSLALDFRRTDHAVEQILAAARDRPFDAILPTSDATAVIAARAAAALGLVHNPPEAAYTARNKLRMREALRAAAVPCPAHLSFPIAAAPEAVAAEAAARIGFPCVLKPLLLSASRGVIRADDTDSFVTAFLRLRALLSTPELRTAAEEDPAGAHMLVEAFAPGPEVALEGVLGRGRFHPLALFDKPDPLDGPFFEETMFVTPSRLPAAAERAVVETIARAAAAMGLREGPVHAELRLGDLLAGRGGPMVLEVAARTIGGLCARTLRFRLGEGEADGQSLEELVIGMALGRFAEPPPLREGAAGVLMLPIPSGGVLRGVHGEEAVRAVPGIVDLVVTARPGEKLVPLPEGASYLGFLFARAATPAAVEAALREGHRRLTVEVAPLL